MTGSPSQSQIRRTSQKKGVCSEREKVGVSQEGRSDQGATPTEGPPAWRGHHDPQSSGPSCVDDGVWGWRGALWPCDKSLVRLKNMWEFIQSSLLNVCKQNTGIAGISRAGRGIH